MPIKTHYSSHLPEPTLRAARAAIAERIDDTSRLRSISSQQAAEPWAPGKTWSRKEVLGHLVDSAHNNTQRFVRAQIASHLTGGVLRLAGYEQDGWVRVAGYSRRDWPEIIDLWVALNRHIVHIIDNFDPGALATPCVVGDDPPLPAEHLIVDYAGHLVYHYKQVVG
jgi:hypothetical protein